MPAEASACGVAFEVVGIRHGDCRLVDGCGCQSGADDDCSLFRIAGEGEAPHPRALGHRQLGQHVSVDLCLVVAGVSLLVAHGIVCGADIVGRFRQLSFEWEHREVAEVVASAAAVLVRHEARVLLEVGRGELHHSVRIGSAGADVSRGQPVGGA